MVEGLKLKKKCTYSKRLGGRTTTKRFMFRKKLVIILLWLLCFFSCTRTFTFGHHNHNNENLDKFNYLGAHKTGYIELKTGETILASYMKLNADSLEYHLFDSKSGQYLSTEKIKKVYFYDHFIGSFNGFWIGLLGSAVIYGTIARSHEPAGYGILGIFGGGALLGSALGSMLSSTIIFEFRSGQIRIMNEN